MKVSKLKGNRSRPYCVRLTTGAERKTFYFRTKSEALKFKALRLTGTAEFDVLVKREKKTLSQFIKEELKRRSSFLEPATILRYEDAAEKFIYPELGYFDLGAIKRIHIEDFKVWLSQQKSSPHSKKICFDFLKGVLKRAYELDEIPKNPALGVRGFPKPESREVYFTLEEIEKFMLFHQDNPRLIVYQIALSCGLRAGEVFALKKEDLNFKKGLIRISKSLDQKTKLIKGTKTKRSRVVPMSDELAHFLKKSILKTEGEFVVPRDLPGLKDNSHASRALRADCKAAKVRVIRFHDLRHTWATHFMEKTGNALLVSRILGHTNLSMASRYMHTSEDQISSKRNMLQLVSEKGIEFDWSKAKE